MKIEPIDHLFILFSEHFQASLETVVHQAGLTCVFARTLDAVESALKYDRYSTIWLEIDDAFPLGLQILEWLKTQNLQSEMGLMLTKAYEKSAQKAINLEGQHFISKSTLESRDEVLRRLMRAQNHYIHRTRDHSVEFINHSQNQTFQWICGSSSARLWLNSVLQAFSRDHVLTLTGPKGCGKSLLLQCLTAPLPSKNIWFWDCEKTASYEQKDQFLKMFERIENQDEIVLAIDEVGELDLELQEVVVEILLGQGVVLSSGRIWPNVKIILSSSLSLDEVLDQKKLREDLYALCHRSTFAILPLNKRREDIQGLIHVFLKQISQGEKRVSQDVVDVCKHYNWPGDIRELHDLIQALCTKVSRSVILASDLPESILEQNYYSSQDEADYWDMPYQDAKKRALHKFNNAYMTRLLDESQQNYTVAAEKAGMDRSNFKKLLKKV